MAEPAASRVPSLVYAAAAALAVAPGVPDALRAPALAVALGWAPGALAAARLAPDLEPARRVLLALVLSPLLAGLPAAALLALGAGAKTAALVVLSAVAASALAAAARPAPRGAADPDPGAGRAAFVAATAWTALIAAYVIGNRAVMTRSDGWFHAALTLQVAARGVPPEDPFFAGFPLHYFWGAHAWSALWLGASASLPPWAPLIALNLAGAGAAILGVAAIARALGAGARGVWAAALAAILGYAPLAWVRLVGRAFAGEVTGWAEIDRLVGLGVGVLAYLSEGLLHASLAFFGDKFLVLTPFAPGLAAFAALAAFGTELIARPTRRIAIAFALIEAAVLFVHTLAGGIALLAAAGALLLAGRRAGLAPALAILLPPLALLPYLAATTLGRAGGLAFGLTPSLLASLLLGGALLVPAGALGLAAAARRSRAGAVHAAWVATVAVLSLVLGLPTSNQAKLLNLLFLLLAAPAGLALLALHDRLARGGRRALLAALAVALLPTSGLAFFGFAREPGPFAAEWERGVPPPEAAGLAWIRASAPADAIVVDAKERLDAPVFAERPVLCGGVRNRNGWGLPLPALEERCRAAAALARRTAPEAGRDGGVRALGRPLLVLTRRRDAAPYAPWPPAPASGFARLYADDATLVERWDPAPASVSLSGGAAASSARRAP